MDSLPSFFRTLAVLAAACGLCVAAHAQELPGGAAIAAEIGKLMKRTHAQGLAVALIDRGQVGFVDAYGIRNAKGDPLTTDTVMYGASLTKTVFAYIVMQLVDQGRLKLDAPLADDLDQPLPGYPPDAKFPDKYGPYKDLADDPRWRKITPRMCLTHSTGFDNFWLGMTRTRLTWRNGEDANVADGCVAGAGDRTIELAPD